MNCENVYISCENVYISCENVYMSSENVYMSCKTFTCLAKMFTCLAKMFTYLKIYFYILLNMKTYLEFSVDGDITEIKTKNKSFDANDYINDYKFVENINYNKYIFILLYNNDNNEKNITKLPFYDRDLYWLREVRSV